MIFKERQSAHRGTRKLCHPRKLWLGIEGIGTWDEDPFLLSTFRFRSDRTMSENPVDTRIRLAAVEHIKRVSGEV